MIIAGLCGGIDRINENRFGVLQYSFHDAACALVENGEVTAAIEEERLNRIKHTNKYPQQALSFCLESRGLGLNDVDCLAFGIRESYLDGVMANRYNMAPSTGLQRGRQFLQSMIEEDFHLRLDPKRFHFVDHHFAHACSAYYPSGFDQALVVTIDGVGDSLSGSVYLGLGNKLELLQTFSEQQSLGFFLSQHYPISRL
jgi:carbamoyltransferase